MALVNGTNYDHIDLHSASGGDVTRHKLQDTDGRAMVAPTEASSTASAAHPAGSYFIYNNKLYQATSDIASGGTITPNTNCKEAPLGASVSDLKSAITLSGTSAQWVSGTYNKSDCSSVNSSTRIRTVKKMGKKTGAMSVKALTGYEFAVFGFDASETYLGMLCDDGSFKKTGGTSVWLNYFNFVSIGNGDYIFHLVLRNAVSPSSDISVSAAANVVFDYITDSTLSVSGAAADAKTVGTRINGLENIAQTSGKKYASSDFTWTLQKGINANGTVYNYNGIAYTSSIYNSGNLTVYNTMSPTGYNGYEHYLFAHEYDSAGTWLRRYSIAPGDAYVLNTDCYAVRFSYGYDPTYGINITQSIIDEYFSICCFNGELASKKYVDDYISYNSESVAPTWKNNTAIISETGEEHASQLLNATDYIEVGNRTQLLQIKMPIFQASTYFGIAFYNTAKQYIGGHAFNVSPYSEYGAVVRTYRLCDLAEKPVYFRTSWYNDTSTYGEWEFTRIEQIHPYIYICASDSSENDKKIADYICTGDHDEQVIGFAARYATYYQVNEIRFARGTYIIDGFPFEDTTGIKIAIPLGTTGTAAKESLLNIVGDGYGSFRTNGTYSSIYSGVQFIVSNDCYASLDSATQYAIFGAITKNGSRYYPGTKFKLSHAMFKLPDNQKNIICIDGYYMSALSFDDIHFTAVAYDGNVSGRTAIPTAELHVGVAGCMAVRGMQGSCYGTDNVWSNAFAWGFGVGFQVVGEHIIGMLLGTRFCTYGYKFGATESAWTLSLIHPNTLINCCDEWSFNLPVFGHGGRSNLTGCRQPITLIDFNLEYRAEYFALGGDLAKELTAGEAYGSIDFAVVDTQNNPGKSKLDFQFWANGYGKNMKTINKAHAISGTTTERNSYTPTYMQQFFDTTLNKMLIYDGTAWRDMNGNEIV